MTLISSPFSTLRTICAKNLLKRTTACSLPPRQHGDHHHEKKVEVDRTEKSLVSSPVQPHTGHQKAKTREADQRTWSQTVEEDKDAEPKLSYHIEAGQRETFVANNVSTMEPIFSRWNKCSHGYGGIPPLVAYEGIPLCWCIGVYPLCWCMGVYPLCWCMGYSPSAGVWGYTPSVGVCGYNPSAGVSGCIPCASVWGCTPSAGVWGYTPSAGVWGCTPSAGVLGYTPSAGVWGYTPSAGVWGFTPSDGVWGNTVKR